MFHYFTKIFDYIVNVFDYLAILWRRLTEPQFVITPMVLPPDPPIVLPSLFSPVDFVLPPHELATLSIAPKSGVMPTFFEHTESESKLSQSNATLSQLANSYGLFNSHDNDNDRVVPSVDDFVDGPNYRVRISAAELARQKTYLTP